MSEASKPHSVPDPDWFRTRSFTYEQRTGAQTIQGQASREVWGLVEQLEALRGLVVQHHAFGAMDGVRAGDDCPVCRGSSVDTNPAKRPSDA